MLKGDNMYDISPSWAYIWQPDVVVHISLRIYQHENKHAYTETTQLEPDKAEMQQRLWMLLRQGTRADGLQVRSWESERSEDGLKMIRRRIQDNLKTNLSLLM